jgi:purine catabolism regulator
MCMALSLRTVVRRMGLRPLAGSLDSAVRWVAVSELEDPTPFLEGDELLLTTGMRLEGDFRDYVDRLVARGVAGLGFAVGLTHDVVPPALVESASRAGLPLVEVPRETPFIAIGKAVSESLAAEQYEEITNAFAAQGRLTRAALRPDGPSAVIDLLAKEIGGWAALLDETGQVRHATPGAHAGAVAGELARLRGAQHHVSGDGGPKGERLPASLALSGPGEHVVVQPLGGGPRPRGFFAVGASRGFSPVAHTVINAAGSLLTLAVEQGGTQLEAERRVRSAVLGLLLERPGEGPVERVVERARTVLGPIGGRLPEEPVVVIALPADALDLIEPHAFTARLHEPPAARPEVSTRSEASGAGPEPSARSAASGGGAEVSTRSEASGGGAEVSARPEAFGAGAEVSAGSQASGAGAEVSRGDAVRSGAGGCVGVALVAEGAVAEVVGMIEGGAGVSAPGRYGELRSGLDQARQALEAGRGQVVRFAELAGQGLIGLLDPAAAQAFAAAVLAPLTRYGPRADLIESLHAYLDANGHWDAAAQRLGVHRHTLRYRMRRVADLLERDLDDPGVRAELWIALEVISSRRDNSRWSPS